MKDNEVMVRVENVSKKFCRSLKRSLVYGMQDVSREMLGFSKKESLRKNEFWAIDDVSFELKRGEAVGLIGPNGAGKSTLLKMLNGLIKPDKGKITMKGRIGALIELGTGFNPLLTGRENIYINGSVLGLTKKEIDAKFDEIVAFSEIEEFIDSPVQNYSSGMKVRLGFAVAANLEPDILLIDEVLAVGDIRFRFKCFDHLVKLQQQGTSMIIVSHGLNQLSRVCDRTLVLNKGTNEFDGGLHSGIVHYDKLMLLSSLHRQKNSILNDRSISIVGKAKNKKDEVTNKFRTGEDIIIELTFSSKLKIENARLSCLIDSPNSGILGAFSTSLSNFEFDIEVGKTNVQLVFSGFPLLTGSYLLNFNLFGKESIDFMLHEKGLISLEIMDGRVKPGFLGGIVFFHHRWELV